MKRTLFQWSLLICMCLSLLVFNTSCSDDDEPAPAPPVEEEDVQDDDDDEEEEEEEEQPAVVEVPDARLSAQIKAALNLEEDDDITEENMLDLEVLDLDGSVDFSGDITEIEDLTGLEYAENLTYLRLSETAITDLSPVAGLRKIEYFRINNTPVTDLSPLSEHTAITYFNANTTTGITDISPLSGNAGMKTMILRDVPFGNDGMETLKSFPEIIRLNMRGTGVTDITVLGEIMAEGALLDSTPGAEENGGATLDLRELNVEDYSPIAPYVDQISNLDGYPAAD